MTAISIILFLEAELKMSNNNSNNQNRTNYDPYLKKCNQRSDRPPDDDNDFQIIKTKPTNKFQQYQIGREMYVPHSG